MRIRDGIYHCAQCGAPLDIPLIEDPRVVIRAASGEPNVRALVLDGKEIHSCVTGPEPKRRATLSPRPQDLDRNFT